MVRAAGRIRHDPLMRALVPTALPQVRCDTYPAKSHGRIHFDDISATVDKFKNAPGALHKSRTDVCPCVVDWKVDFSDIPCVVDGFRGLPIPCDPPAEPCP